MFSYIILNFSICIEIMLQYRNICKIINIRISNRRINMENKIRVETD